MTQSGDVRGTTGLLARTDWGRIVCTVRDQLSPAEDLPALYRAVLDAVAILERRGARHEASRIRYEATQAYSRAWDEEQRQRLEHLVERSRNVIDQPVRSMERSLWRRTSRRSVSP